MKPALVLRSQDFAVPAVPDLSKTKDDDYHGGWLTDELAALCSLLLEVRMMPGPIEREFEVGGDPMGRPRPHASDLLPFLPMVNADPQIPRLLEQKSLGELSRLCDFIELDASRATTLVKSARLYQQALWIADSSPEMAWLLLVSAIETAAVSWDVAQLTAEEKLTLAFPSLSAHLHEFDNSDLVATVADHLHPLTGTTSKFVSFIEAFAPAPPAVRPTFGLFDYEPRALRKSMSKVYGYRSRALHAGTPFPSSMSWPPSRHQDQPAYDETPTGTASGSRGASWRVEDTPLLLHTFAYIARGALLNWWTELARCP